MGPKWLDDVRCCQRFSGDSAWFPWLPCLRSEQTRVSTSPEWVRYLSLGPAGQQCSSWWGWRARWIVTPAGGHRRSWWSPWTRRQLDPVRVACDPNPWAPWQNVRDPPGTSRDRRGSRHGSAVVSSPGASPTGTRGFGAGSDQWLAAGLAPAWGAAPRLRNKRLDRGWPGVTKCAGRGSLLRSLASEGWEKRQTQVYLHRFPSGWQRGWLTLTEWYRCPFESRQRKRLFCKLNISTKLLVSVFSGRITVGKQVWNHQLMAEWSRSSGSLCPSSSRWCLLICGM